MDLKIIQQAIPSERENEVIGTLVPFTSSYFMFLHLHPTNYKAYESNLKPYYIINPRTTPVSMAVGSPKIAETTSRAAPPASWQYFFKVSPLAPAKFLGDPLRLGILVCSSLTLFLSTLKYEASQLSTSNFLTHDT